MVPIASKEGVTYFATAKHVIGESTDLIAINSFTKVKHPAGIIHWISPTVDLAIVAFRLTTDVVLIAENPPMLRGSKCYSLGHPHPRLPCLVFQGLLQGGYSFTGDAAPGMSGGAVLDEHGRLLGIITQYLPKRTDNQFTVVSWGSVGFFLPARLLPLP